MMPNRWVLPATVGAGGLGTTALVAGAGGLSAGDTATLIGYAVGGAMVAGLLAGGLLRLLRGSSIVVLAAVAALAPVLAVGIGVAGAASAMFISSHDLHGLFVVLAAAGTVALLIALVLGR